jgi:hypothetical protein
MRTIDEIVAKARDKSWGDLFGTKQGGIIDYLPFELAQEFLIAGTTAEQWAANGAPRPRDQQAIIAQIRDYMPFAWGKANACRGLSAMRSIYHMQAWLWILGVDETQLDNYTHYGKPQLRAVCEAFGIDWQSLDDGRWTNEEYGPGNGPIQPAPLTLPPTLEAALQAERVGAALPQETAAISAVDTPPDCRRSSRGWIPRAFPK